MKKTVPEKLLKRSAAAAMLGVGPRTLARYEMRGLLTPIKTTCRSVFYRDAEILRLLTGEVQTSPDRPTVPASARTKRGEFAPLKGVRP